MMRMVLFSILAFCFLPGPGLAQHQHGSHPASMPASGNGKKGEASPGREYSSKRVFLLEGGIRASFAITPTAEHKKMLQDMRMRIEVDPRTTHNISVNLVDVRSNEPLNEAVVKMKVISPKGKDEIKMLDSIPAMNQYSGDFTLSEKGRYQILILFRAGGKKQAAGFYYRLK